MYVEVGMGNYGLGCANGKCDCGGKCKGLGQTFMDELTNPLGTDLDVLKQQLSDLNQKSAETSSAIATGNVGTWLLVGLAGWGIYAAYQTAREKVEGVRQWTQKRRTRSVRRRRLEAELAGL